VLTLRLGGPVVADAKNGKRAGDRPMQNEKDDNKPFTIFTETCCGRDRFYRGMNKLYIEPQYENAAGTMKQWYYAAAVVISLAKD
jgi:hypothetical protein